MKQLGTFILGRSLALAAVGVALIAGTTQASDPVGIYALVDKVVLEPNDKEPERIQIWGAFSLAEGQPGPNYAQPKSGYLYYKLNPDKPDVCRKEWADLKSIAGSDQVIAFGSRRAEHGKIRAPDTAAKDPDVYPLGFGLQKVRSRNEYGPVKALRNFAESRRKTAWAR